MHAERNTGKIQSRREFLKKSALYGVGLTAFASIPRVVFGNERNTAVIEIPHEMEKLGFELVPYEGTHLLVLPALEVDSYTPDLHDVPGVGYFTRIDFDPRRNMVAVKTSEGESGTIIIDQKKNTLLYTNTFRREATSAVCTYEPDRFVREWVMKNETLFSSAASIQYDEKSQELTVWKNAKQKADQSKRIYTEKVILPTHQNMRILLEKYLKISDALGKQFTKGVVFGPTESNKHVLMSLNPFGLNDEKASFDYTIGSVSSGCMSVQGLLDNLMVNSIYKQEFDERAQNISIGEQNILARGPNRNGDFELTSGKTSIIYHPTDGSLQLARGWNTFGAVSIIVGGNLAQGTLVVKDDYGEGRYQVWRLNISFQNTDPNASYRAVLLEDTRAKK